VDDTRSNQPLRGLSVLNTREAGAARALSDPLERLGARVIACPTIAFAPPESWRDFDLAWDRLARGQWIVLTSATALRFVAERLAQRGRDLAPLRAMRIAAVGAGTAEALGQYGLEAALVPERFQAEGLLEALVPRLRPGEPLWYPRAEDARPVLEEGLRAAGAGVTATVAYRTVPAEGLGNALGALRRGAIDWICFTSASTVRHFWEALPEADRAAVLNGPKVACIGRITAQAAEALGFRVSALPERQDIPGLVEAIVRAVRAA